MRDQKNIYLYFILESFETTELGDDQPISLHKSQITLLRLITYILPFPLLITRNSHSSVVFMILRLNA